MCAASASGTQTNGNTDNTDAAGRNVDEEGDRVDQPFVLVTHCLSVRNSVSIRTFSSVRNSSSIRARFTSPRTRTSALGWVGVSVCNKRIAVSSAD
jgi:hypothetical protein